MSQPSTAMPWCPVAATIAVIGGRWKPTILFHLKDGPRRFNQLRQLVPGITQRMLTLQLRALEEDGIVQRTVSAHVPPQVEYAFTPRGITLGPILEAMERWGESNGSHAARRHKVERMPQSDSPLSSHKGTCVARPR
jgi:DNA-binding HxlR family transcriptional regulator